MRTSVLIILLVCACEPPPVAPEPAAPRVVPVVEAPRVTAPARFGEARSRVGDRWTVRTRATSRTHIGDSGVGPQLTEYVSALEVRVLAVAGGGEVGPAPTKLALYFLQNERTQQGALAPTALHGRRYVLDAAVDGVRDEQGAEVSADERDQVLDVFPDVGTSARLEQALPGGDLVAGQVAPGLPEAALRSLHPRAWSFEAGRATVARVDGADAELEVTLSGRSQRGLHVTLSGVVRARLSDRRLVRLRLRGPFEGRDAMGESRGEIVIERDVE